MYVHVEGGVGGLSWGRERRGRLGCGWAVQLAGTKFVGVLTGYCLGGPLGKVVAFVRDSRCVHLCWGCFSLCCGGSRSSGQGCLGQ